MTDVKTVILGDWGTTRCRLYLARIENAQWKLVDRIDGRGVKGLGNIEWYFLAMTHNWRLQHNVDYAVLAGAVGSNIGWKETSYVACPESICGINQHCVEIDCEGIPVKLVPGMACDENPLGLPDVMRGEETQLLGYLRHKPQSSDTQNLFCLPGTHSKWVVTAGDKVTSIHSIPTGEMYDVLVSHSILADRRERGKWEDKSFFQGLNVASKTESSLLTALFSTRSFRLIDPDSTVHTQSYMSGICIGSEMKDVLALYTHNNEKPPQHLTLVGSGKLTELYHLAAQHFGLSCDVYDGDTAVYKGLLAIAEGFLE